jgi:hypothetical protein
MGHKSVIIFDHDVIDHMENDPAEFVRRLKHAMFTHRRAGGSVSVSGATVANVVWSGHSSLTPVLKIEDFKGINVTYDAQELESLGFRLAAAETN